MTANEFVLIIAPAAAGQAGPPPPVYEPEYQAVLDYAAASGIPLPDETQRATHNARLAAWKAAGIWAARDFVFHFEGSNAAFSLIDWKRLTMATAVSAPTYDPANGWASDGVAAFINLNFNPGTAGGNWQSNNSSVLSKSTGVNFTTTQQALILGQEVTQSNYWLSAWTGSSTTATRLGAGAAGASNGLLANVQGTHTVCGRNTAQGNALQYVDAVLRSTRVHPAGVANANVITLRSDTRYSSQSYFIGIIMGGADTGEPEILAFHNSVI